MTLPLTGRISWADIANEIYADPNHRVGTDDPYLVALANNGRIDTLNLHGWTYRNDLMITLGDTTRSVTPSNLANLSKSFSGGHSQYRPGATNVKIIVPSGVLILSDSALTPSLTVSGWVADDDVHIDISGRVQGRGGTGGRYDPGVQQTMWPDNPKVYARSDGYVKGQSGGIALECLCPVAQLRILPGGILAGGGGGGIFHMHQCENIYSYLSYSKALFFRAGGSGAGYGASVAVPYSAFSKGTHNAKAWGYTDAEAFFKYNGVGAYFTTSSNMSVVVTPSATLDQPSGHSVASTFFVTGTTKEGIKVNMKREYVACGYANSNLAESYGGALGAAPTVSERGLYYGAAFVGAGGAAVAGYSRITTFSNAGAYHGALNG